MGRNLEKTAAPSVGNNIKGNKNYFSIKQTNPRVDRYMISLALSLPVANANSIPPNY